VLTNFDEIVSGTATELKFGPTYTGTASLVDSEKILTIDPSSTSKATCASPLWTCPSGRRSINGQSAGGTAQVAAAKRGKIKHLTAPQPDLRQDRANRHSETPTKSK